jgi:hypothetical protein
MEEEAKCLPIRTRDSTLAMEFKSINFTPVGKVPPNGTDCVYSPNGNNGSHDSNNGQIVLSQAIDAGEEVTRLIENYRDVREADESC